METRDHGAQPVITAPDPARGRRQAGPPRGAGAPGEGWWLVLTAAVVLALLSLASNVATATPPAGPTDGALSLRRTLSEVLNAGVVWAGLPVLAGRLLRRPGPAALAGVASSLTALLVHYGTGRLLDVFAPTVWAENVSWFVIATLAGAPLGVVGALTRRRSRWGSLSRLTVPVGALLEPWVRGMFAVPASLPWPDRVSGVLSGSVLVAAGTAGVLVAIREVRGSRRHGRSTRPS